MKTSIIIPCYNEEELIETTYKRVLEVMETEIFDDYEIVFIDDGSSDKTLSILKKTARNNLKIKLLSFSRNFGHQPAVAAGLANCTGDIAIIIDADLQDPPELFPEMLKIYREQQCQVVYGVRRSRQGETRFKKWTSKLFYRFINRMSEVEFPLDAGDFRLINREVIDHFNHLKEKNKYIRGLISWLGFKQVPMYYDRKKRFAGTTKYSLTKMLKLASTGLLSFSKKPLTLAINLGFASVFIGLLLLVYVFFSKFYLSEEYITGWASTILIIIFFGGIQLITVGIIGTYIGNILDEVKQRPEYVIQEKVNCD